MFVDSSALTAILTDESDARILAARLQRSTKRITSPLVVWETVLAVARILKTSVQRAESMVEDYLAIAQVSVIAIAPEARSLAIEAHDRYGKSRHPASLNFGDCFSYACARHERVPLLYKGDDFARTDVEAA